MNFMEELGIVKKDKMLINTRYKTECSCDKQLLHHALSHSYYYGGGLILCQVAAKLTMQHNI
jgi:hypothetical protein